MVELTENVTYKDKIEGETSISNITETDNIVYIAADKYLDFVTQQEKAKTDKKALIDKRDKLVKLGFTNSQEVKEGNIEIARLKRLDTLNKEKAHMVTIIDYFASKYSGYKYMPQKYVDEISEKYGLENIDAPNYTGTIPDETVEQIEKLNVELCDKCFTIINAPRVNLKKWNEKDSLNHFFQELPLLIIVQPKSIKWDGMKSEDSQIDPKKEGTVVFTVLKPVLYEDVKNYLIVTAWELEGSEELVVNHRNN